MRKIVQPHRHQKQQNCYCKTIFFFFVMASLSLFLGSKNIQEDAFVKPRSSIDLYLSDIAGFGNTSDSIATDSATKVLQNLTTAANFLEYPKEKLIPMGQHYQIPKPEERIGPDGAPQYVHIPTFLHESPRPFRMDNATAPECKPPGQHKGEETEEVMAAYNKIKTHIKKVNPATVQKIRLFCSIYTYPGGVKWTNAVSETWGKRCDGMLYASYESNITTGHVHVPSVKSPFQFEYRGIWQRQRAILAYIYDNFLDDYDYFQFNGDDVYLIVENLKEFLDSEKVRSWEEIDGNLLFAGQFLATAREAKERIPNSHYLGGGSGYTMSKKALKAFVEGPLQTCKANDQLRASAEDVLTSICFREHLTGDWIDTRDDVGAHRYHQLSLRFHAHAKPNTRLFNMARFVFTTRPALL